MSIERAIPWQVGAPCGEVDPEVFFPKRGESSKAAKKICADCVVLDDCKADVLANPEEFGIRAGMTVKEQKKFRKENAA